MCSTTNDHVTLRQCHVKLTLGVVRVVICFPLGVGQGDEICQKMWSQMMIVPLKE